MSQEPRQIGPARGIVRVLAIAICLAALAPITAQAGRFRSGNLPPVVSIDSPSGGVVVTAGDTVDLTASASDPDGNYPLSYQWFIGPGSGVPSQNVEDPGPLVFDTPGTFYVVLMVHDSLGKANESNELFWVVVKPAPVVVDNTDPGFSSTGSWGPDIWPLGYVGPNFAAMIAGTGGGAATWTFPVAETATYAVSANWPLSTASWASTSVTYSLVNNGNTVATVETDQTNAGGRYNVLAEVPLQAGTLEVVLPQSPTGWTIADAVRLDRVAVSLTQPRFDAVKPGGDLDVNATLTGLPPFWGVEFVVDGDLPGAVQDLTPPFSLPLSGVAPGEHVVEAVLIDEMGRRVPGVSADADFGVGDYYLAVGDSITKGFGDQITGDNTSTDGRNRSKGFTPILNDLLTTSLGQAHTVEVNGVDNSQSFDGLNRLPGKLLEHPDANVLLIQFGTNDALWSQRPSGLGLQSGDAGYDDSFKDYMTQIVTLILGDGRDVMLAKPPPVLGNHGLGGTVLQLNALLTEYGQVIDELNTQFSLDAGPDFYTYFDGATNEYWDECHMSGVGYQSMATLWRDAILAP